MNRWQRLIDQFQLSAALKDPSCLEKVSSTHLPPFPLSDQLDKAILLASWWSDGLISLLYSKIFVLDASLDVIFLFMCYASLFYLRIAKLCHLKSMFDHSPILIMIIVNNQFPHLSHLALKKKKQFTEIRLMMQER